MKTKHLTLANPRDLAIAHGRGAAFEELMALGGLGEEALRAVMSCDMFKGLARAEAERLASGAI